MFEFNRKLIVAMRAEKEISVSTMAQTLGYVNGDYTYHRFELGQVELPITRSGLIAYTLGCRVRDLFMPTCKQVNKIEEKP
ncbi:hypothetical protein CN899_08140 [Bacillus thuringiensis]|uniref:Uncharacterized protein n=1 Tax=Bacillus thuringiensis TaxID=1428 RepID=A0A9X7C273_BACTU|nr:hypothetical protein [Bacillus thuringiensis]PGH85796.1 hypothetical protein CN899_08140 [Bacillus thuringiensis]